MNQPLTERALFLRRKLHRLRLDAEPIPVQLARYRRATLVLTAIVSALGLIFLCLFAGFGRPDVGLVVVIVLLGPIMAWAWLDFAILRSRAAAYLAEFDETPQ